MVAVCEEAEFFFNTVDGNDGEERYFNAIFSIIKRTFFTDERERKIPL